MCKQLIRRGAAQDPCDDTQFATPSRLLAEYKWPLMCQSQFFLSSLSPQDHIIHLSLEP